MPCEERLFEQGLCQTGDNPLWWPQSIDLEESQGIKPGYFAWFVRVVWLGGRMQSETYRSAGELDLDWKRTSRELTFSFAQDEDLVDPGTTAKSLLLRTCTVS